MDPKQKGLVYEEVKREMAAEDMFADTPSGPEKASPNFSPLNAVLQFRDSYLVAQDDDPSAEPGLIIVDQHALHERVMFEELRKRILVEGKNLESQRLLMPAVCDADASRQAILQELEPLLTRLGIEADAIGPDAVAIHAFPSLLFDRSVEPAAFLADLFDQVDRGELKPDSLPPSASEQPSDDSAPSASNQTDLQDRNMLQAEAALHKVLDMMSCKAAVKAGDALSPDELTSLLAKRHEIERSSSCPHGRPTTIRLTLRDLEKHFHRA
jgi:DNA mismatch repair protein MutL